jgi:hypothetical protein
MDLTVGYAATSSDAFTVTGSPAPSVTKTSGNAAIPWNSGTKKLDIAAGLGAGTYPVTLTATNGTAPDATASFTLTVASGGTTGGGGTTGPGTGGGGAVAVPVPATPTPPAPLAPTNPFADVLGTDWFYDVVLYVYDKGLMTGTSTSPMMFSPRMTLTRGTVVTVLYRMQNAVPAIAYANPFDDVDDGEWYASAVKWAYHNGVVSGYGDGKFGPDDPITREQMAAILLNYELFAQRVPADILMDREFDDWANIADWAKNAVNRLTMQGMIAGTAFCMRYSTVTTVPLVSVILGENIMGFVLVPVIRPLS